MRKSGQDESLVGSHRGNLVVPVSTRHSLVLGKEDRAVRTASLAPVGLTSLNIDAHISEMVTRIEGEEDAISARRIFTRAVALLIRGGSLALEDLSRNMMPVDLVHSGRQVGNRIAVVSHSPARSQLSLQPGREGQVTDTRRAESGQLDVDGRSMLIEERKVSSGMSGQGSSKRVSNGANGAARRARLESSSHMSVNLSSDHLVSIPES